jgi:hypothetical protein
MRAHLIILGCLALITCVPASSASSKLAELPVSKGIADPSRIFSVFENPAGIVDSGADLSFQAGYKNCCPASEKGIAALNYGNGTIGLAAGLGYRHYNDSAYDGRLSFLYGGSFRIPGSSFSFGVSGDTESNAVSVGMQYAPMGPLKFGITSYDVTNASRTFGAGASLHVVGVSAIALDAVADHSFKTFALTPGLRLDGGTFGATAGYTYTVASGSSGSSFSADNISAGAFVKLDSKWGIHAYYQTVTKYYAVLTRSL